MYSSVPKDLRNIDIVNIGSALQYVEDYRALLLELADKRPEFILLTDHHMDDTKTYATCQINMANIGIPYWIFNLDEIVAVLDSRGYKLAFASRNLRSHSFDVPDEFKVRDPCNLLFVNGDRFR